MIRDEQKSSARLARLGSHLCEPSRTKSSARSLRAEPSRPPVSFEPSRADLLRAASRAELFSASFEPSRAVPCEPARLARSIFSSKILLFCSWSCLRFSKIFGLRPILLKIIIFYLILSLIELRTSTIRTSHAILVLCVVLFWMKFSYIHFIKFDQFWKKKKKV